MFSGAAAPEARGHWLETLRARRAAGSPRCNSGTEVGIIHLVSEGA